MPQRTKNSPPPSVRRRRAGSVALALSAVVLAACGGGTDDSATASPGGSAEPWPTDDVRFVVGADAGGGLDTAARLLAPGLGESLGVNVVVENKPGADTAIGATIVAEEGGACDVLSMANFPIMLFAHLINDVSWTYDDFYPVAAVQAQPSVIVVPGNSPYGSVSDLIADIESRPGEVTASVSALASTNNVGLIQMEDELGLDINVVNFDGGGPARTAVISGEVDFSHTSLYAALPLLSGGELKILAAHQTEEDWAGFQEQLPAIADVPTLAAETGDDDFASNTATYGVLVARDCFDEHPERHQELVDSLQELMDSDDFTARLEELELESSRIDVTPEEYHEAILEDQERVTAVAEEIF